MAYGVLLKTFKNRQGKCGLILLSSSLIAYARSQLVTPGLTSQGMKAYYLEVSHLVNSESKIERYYAYMAKRNPIQKLAAMLLNAASALLKLDQGIPPTVLELGYALSAITSINLLAGEAVTIQVFDESVTLDPPN